MKQAIYSFKNLHSIPVEILGDQDLSYLDLQGNLLKEIPESITKFKKINTLLLTSNRISEIPEGIGNLRALKELNLGFNLLREIPPILGELENLEIIDLRNNQIKEIPASIFELPKLQRIDIRGNPLVRPPVEVAAKGLDAIRAYFRQIEETGFDRLTEAKLIIIGEAGAGKTSLTRKIIDPEYELNPAELSTHGIDISRWEFQAHNSSTIKINLWDFGGQEIYYATHQFFLTKRSLYILVADDRSENTNFTYWLNLVDVLSNNSPIIIVKNEKQDRKRDIEEFYLKRNFQNLKRIIETNLKTGRYFDRVISAVRYHASELPLIGMVLPMTWWNVRAELEKDERDYIRVSEYFDICDRNGFQKHGEKLQLSEYLHDIGVILHFHEDPVLKSIVILNPLWATEAVYKLLDHNALRRQKGVFYKNQLRDIWFEDCYNMMHDELLQLMMMFKLCYFVTKERFIAPQLLPLEPEPYNWSEKDNLVIKYKFEFLPQGIIAHFIVNIHQYIENDKLVWKKGVIIKRGLSRAEVVEYQGRREIVARSYGPEKKAIMSIVTYEIDKILSFYERLSYSKLVPCICKTCTSIAGRHFYPLSILYDHLEHENKIIQCQNPPFSMVNILKILHESLDKQQLLGTKFPLHIYKHTNRPSDEIRFKRELKQRILKISAQAKARTNIALAVVPVLCFIALIGLTFALRIKAVVFEFGDYIFETAKIPVATPIYFLILYYLVLYLFNFKIDSMSLVRGLNRRNMNYLYRKNGITNEMHEVWI